MPVFENPTAFLFLLFIPLVFILRKLGIFKRISFPLTFCDWEGDSFSWNEKFRRFFAILVAFIHILAFTLVVLSFAEPVIHNQEKIYMSKGAEILFVLDTSPSMASKDIAGMTRLDASKIGIRTLVNANKGASFGLVAMASESAALVPPTVDHKLFLERLDSLRIGTLGDGSAIGVGLSSAVYHLVSSNAQKKCIVLITDGENNAGTIHPDTAAFLVKENNISLYIFGIGTKGSVPIEYVDSYTGKVYSGYYESEFNAASLEQIAVSAGGRYFGVESTAALSEAISSINRRGSVAQTFHYRTVTVKLYMYFLAGAGILFVISWILRRIVLREV